MGNICSRSANKSDDPFSRPGRPLGSSESQTQNKQTTARVPDNQSHFASPGRTLGGDEQQPSAETDAKAKAALAAQKRADAATQPSGKGKLGSKLAAQKAQTRTQTLDEASRDERAARDAEGAAEARRWQ